MDDAGLYRATLDNRSLSTVNTWEKLPCCCPGITLAAAGFWQPLLRARPLGVGLVEKPGKTKARQGKLPIKDGPDLAIVVVTDDP